MSDNSTITRGTTNTTINGAGVDNVTTNSPKPCPPKQPLSVNPPSVNTGYIAQIDRPRLAFTIETRTTPPLLKMEQLGDFVHDETLRRSRLTAIESNWSRVDRRKLKLYVEAIVFGDFYGEITDIPTRVRSVANREFVQVCFEQRASFDKIEFYVLPGMYVDGYEVAYTELETAEKNRKPYSRGEGDPAFLQNTLQMASA